MTVTQNQEYDRWRKQPNEDLLDAVSGPFVESKVSLPPFPQIPWRTIAVAPIRKSMLYVYSSDALLMEL